MQSTTMRDEASSSRPSCSPAGGPSTSEGKRHSPRPALLHQRACSARLPARYVASWRARQAHTCGRSRAKKRALHAIAAISHSSCHTEFASLSHASHAPSGSTASADRTEPYAQQAATTAARRHQRRVARSRHSRLPTTSSATGAAVRSATNEAGRWLTTASYTVDRPRRTAATARRRETLHRRYCEMKSWYSSSARPTNRFDQYRCPSSAVRTRRLTSRASAPRAALVSTSTGSCSRRVIEWSRERRLGVWSCRRLGLESSRSMTENWLIVGSSSMVCARRVARCSW
mmetsp:Transcript_11462/g.33098  ORF Transcript_11462/g.33098 Transcript_11462/m.33098 type:complete len:288 (+) Transcript_11462:300-1163(+)